MDIEHPEHLTPRGLERRLKRHLLKAPQRFLAITVPGMEPVLESEIRSLPGTENVSPITGGVEFGGPLDLAYVANLRLRSAVRVLMRIDSCTARSYPELYNKARRIPWELYIGFATEISFSVSSRSSRLHHTGNIEKALFDAIFAHMKNLGREVAHGAKAPGCFFIRLNNDECTISIDTSGEPLYKRGYRTDVGRAPLRENLAAAICLAAHTERFGTILDPMCGTGVILVEAAMLGAGHYPCAEERTFALQSLPFYQETRMERLRRETLSLSHEIAVALHGSDIDEHAVGIARNVAAQAGLPDSVVFEQRDFFTTNAPASIDSRGGLIVSNLPYGKRIGNASEMKDLYRKIGQHMRRKFQGWHFAFVAPDPLFAMHAGLDSTGIIRFRNGGLPVALHCGEIR